MTPSDFGIAGVIGALLPLLIAVLNRQGWTTQIKSVFALVVCLAAAAITSFVSDGVDLNDPSFDWVAWAGTIYASAMVSFSRFWKPTEVSEKIESSTG